jgi:hypothetical protein
LILSLLLLLLGGCAGSAPKPMHSLVVAEQRVGELQQAILALGDEIHPGEAQRAARAALEYSRQLAHEYRVTDSAIVHNIKVNLGLKQRGLCIDWTSDMMARLRQEKFASLDLHWAIANYESALRLEHSTVVISAHGDSLDQGLVLDPWRFSGDLYWARATQDPGYNWKPQGEIHALKRQHEYEARNRSLDR